MTVTDDEVALSDEDRRRTLRDVRRVARLLLQGLEPDERRPEPAPSPRGATSASDRTRSPVTSEEIPLHRTVDSDIAIAEIAGARPRGAAARPGRRRRCATT